MISNNLEKIIDEVNEASKEIPFGNSEFQNINFVLNAELTPERAYRHCLLRLNNRISALREAYYSLKLEDIDIEEMEEQLQSDTTNKFEKKRLEIKIEQKKINRNTTEKLVSDCLIEVNTLYAAFEKLPKYTRLEFESGERKHFELKLARDLILPNGSMQSLDSMKANDWAEKVINTNGKALKEEIEKIRMGVLGNVDKVQKSIK